jgi:lipoprotein LprG
MTAVRAPWRRMSVAAIAAVLAGLLGLAGCSDDGSDATPEELADRLAAAKAQLDEAASIEFQLAADELPDDVTGLLEADGTGTREPEPAFEGEVSVSAMGGVEADVIAIADEVWAKISFSPGYVPVDPSDLGAPNPATIFDPDAGVTSFLTSTEGLESGEQSRDGDLVLTTVTGSLPGDVVQRLIPSADESADFDVEYRISDDDVLHDAVMVGPFYGDAGDVTYTMSLSASDEPVEITEP